LQKEGFNTFRSEAKCGREYYIEGADSLSVCMGKTCNGKSGICTNCASGLSQDCASRSATEHQCSDCRFGGNVITSARLLPQTVWMYLYCDSTQNGDRRINAEELVKLPIPINDENEVDTANSGGYVSSICVQNEDFELRAQQIENFRSECIGDGGTKMGMMMFVFLDHELSAPNLASLIAAAATKEKAQPNPYNEFVTLASGPISPVSLIISTQADNFYYFVNKATCNTNLLDTSIAFNQNIFASFLKPETASFESMLAEFATKYPAAYELYTSEAWSLDETKDIVENGTKVPCGITATP